MSLTKDLDLLLSDYQVLYHKLRTYHWNVTGPMFFALHAKFEELYNEAALRVDELAERILALGEKPTATLRAQLDQARLTEDGGPTSANDMVANLVADYGSLNGWLREVSGKAGSAEDSATANMLEEFADAQEKTAWMLKAFLAQ